MNAIRFIHDLVAIKSLSGEEQNAAEFIVKNMLDFGFDSAFVDEAGNSVGERANPNEDGSFDHTIVMLGHMDTVPGDIPVRIEDGILHGRGSVDAKGPLATFVIATAQAEIPQGHRLIVIGATEEESATSKGARFARTQYNPDWCIIGEPSNWDAITLGYKGRILIDYHHSQDMAHTAGADLGAAEVGIIWYNDVMSHIAQFNSENEKLFAQLLPSVRHIHTDSDGLQNTIDIKLGIRLPPKFDIDAYKAQLQQWAGDATLTFSGIEEAYFSTRKTKLAKTFHRAMLKRGIKPRYKMKTGTSDMNVVGPVWQCPIVAYGPGDSTLDHTPIEHLELEEYQNAIDLLTAVLST